MIFQIFDVKNLSVYEIHTEDKLQVGLCQICQHNLKHNRQAHYASIMLA